LKKFPHLTCTSPILFPLAAIFTNLPSIVKELTIKYNKLKVLKYLSLSIILLAIFGLITINYEYLAHIPPSSSGRHRWVGKLFYERENLLLGISLFLNLLFLVLLADSLSMLIRGKLELTKVNGIIYKNGKYFVEQNDIKKTALFDNNNNSSILIYLKSLNNVISKRETKLDQFLVKGFLLINKNKIQIRLSFLENSKKNYENIREFLKQKNNKNYSYHRLYKMKPIYLFSLLTILFSCTEKYTGEVSFRSCKIKYDVLDEKVEFKVDGQHGGLNLRNKNWYFVFVKNIYKIPITRLKIKF